MEARELQLEIAAGKYDDLLLDIYVDEAKITYQKQRYTKAIEEYVSVFGNEDVEIYSAPGRSEVGGNHTDHQQGEVLAASINNDAIAIVHLMQDQVVRIASERYGILTVYLDDIDMVESEKETTISLIKGVLYKAQQMGYKIGGFQAYVTSDVLIGAGLSSSAAYETLIGTILSGLYNEMKIDPIEIAIIGQFAENVYFGKPCGLMDQMACSVGNLVHINFADIKNPKVEKVTFDLNKHGYSLCITDTKGSHADLTADYAAIPKEMKNVAACFGKDVLLGITVEDILKNIAIVRGQVGDRGVLRALHFIRENERVRKEVEAFVKNDIVTEYQKIMDKVFGQGACSVLKIRKYGGMKVL